MKGVISFKQNESGGGDGIAEGPQDIEQLSAMSDFKKNLKAGDYIDCDLYGREDSRVLSRMTSTGEGSSKTQMQSVKRTRTSSSRQARFVPTGFFGRKIRSMIGKMSKTMDCFCWSSSASNATDDDEVEAISPVAVASQPSSHQNRQETSNDRPLVGTETLEEKLSTTLETCQDVQAEGVEEQEEEEKEAPGRVDDTPRRVRSKVNSEDDLSVVEKGMVAKTLTKLRSSGSFVFQERRSHTQDVLRKDGDAHAGKDSCLGSRGSAQLPEDALSAKSRDDGRPHEGCMAPIEISRSGSNGSAPLFEENASVKAILSITPDNGIPAGRVRKLRSLFEEDTSSEIGAVSGREFEAKEEENPSVPRRHHNGTCVRSKAENENVQIDAGVPNGSSDVDRDSYDASTATIPPSEVKTVGSALQVDRPDVPDDIIIPKVSSSPKVTVLALQPIPFKNEKRRLSELEESETASDMKEVEQAPPLSVQLLTRHLSGQVQKMKAQFESNASKGMANNDCEVASESETYHIRAGLSGDSGLLSSEDVNVGETIEREGHSPLQDAKNDNAGSKSCGAIEATAAATEAAKAADEDAKQFGNIGITPEIVGCVNGRADMKHNNENEGMSEVVVWEVAGTLEPNNESHRSSRDSSHVDSVDYSSSSVASSDNLSQPFSHFCFAIGVKVTAACRSGSTVVLVPGMGFGAVRTETVYATLQRATLVGCPLDSYSCAVR
ncbi:hypothetical protein FGB62_25g429 [Gracilaria domingensis]|nr:hypothetical protein FGB62_25g429 [Gracilaria domingensis]